MPHTFLVVLAGVLTEQTKLTPTPTPKKTVGSVQGDVPGDEVGKAE